MEYDIDRITFFEDPGSYQAGSDELCVYLPAGISSIKALVSALGEGVGEPAELDITWWNTLSHMLQYRLGWKTTPRRVMLLHADLPRLIDPPQTWWYQQIYLRLLLRVMEEVRVKHNEPVDPFREYELVVGFPAQIYEEVRAVLFHPPVWQATIGFSEYLDIADEWTATWATVQRYLHALDGLVAQTCELYREDVGNMTVFYRKADSTYHIEHQPMYASDYKETFAVREEWPGEFSGLSFEEMYGIVKTFFTTGQLSSSVHWILFDDETRELQNKFRGEEHLALPSWQWLPDTTGVIRDTIRDGMREAVQEIGEEAFHLGYWRELLSRQDIPTARRLAALCIIGFSTLPEAATLLRPFLRSTEKRERWVSATILGRQREEEALHILLSMLTDELPFKRSDGIAYDAWYDCWRFYALRLLHDWPLPAKESFLREALRMWIEAEPLLDTEYDIWEGFVKVLRAEFLAEEDGVL